MLKYNMINVNRTGIFYREGGNEAETPQFCCCMGILLRMSYVLQDYATISKLDIQYL